MTHGAGARTSANGCNPRGTTLAKDLKWSDLRRQLALSIRDFSDLTGINRGDLSKIERGQACPTPFQATAIMTVWSIRMTVR
jgi:DNA-binding transcriptional regulator YiaG